MGGSDMKVMIRRNQAGRLTVYIPKKDLEEEVVAREGDGAWGGTVTLANGMRLFIEPAPEEPRLPLTLEARRLDA